MTRMECDFCGREIKNGEVWYHCEQDSKCYGIDWNVPVEADVCFECFSKAFKNAMKERESNDTCI